MSKHKRKIGFQSKQPAAQKPSKIRLSQCMIVKNEERNIEKALSWAKGIAFEQIVVDTGSTDKTVEIAERMGAKVYHFEWINDFSAAKNFAIEQATGNWIAFLDADEYFPDDDLWVIIPMLENPNIGGSYDAIMCAMLQVDDAGKTFAVHDHMRIFRNLPELRYVGSIHESMPVLNTRITRVSDISIIHTGYSKSSYADFDKAERNIRMIRAEYEKDTDNPNMMIYLADSLLIDSDDEKKREANELYSKALKSERSIIDLLERRALAHVITTNVRDTSKAEEMEELCLRAIKTYPESIDFLFYYSVFLNTAGKREEAWEKLVECEKMLSEADSFHVSTHVVAKPMLLFFEMAKTSFDLGDRASSVKYCTLVLMEDKYQLGMLTPYINILKAGASFDEMLALLGKIYDLGSIKDKMFICKAARNTGDRALLGKFMELITPEEREWMSGGNA